MAGLTDFIEEVWMKNRSLVTDGYDEALEAVRDYADSDLQVHEIPSGTDVWTWTVPQKWSVNEAYISDGEEKLLEYDHPLRVVTYSNPVDRWVSHEELMDHLHWDASREDLFDGSRLPRHPDAIPYVFKFYDDDWGFCVRERELDRFDAKEYHIVIDATFEPGTLKVGESTVEGEREETVFLMAHLDHPAQVNDDLAGVAVGIELMNRLAELDTRYTYTFLIVPETIGSIAFFSKNQDRIPVMEYGIYLEMLGTDGTFSLQRSYPGNTEIDRAAEYVLDARGDPYDSGDFREVIRNDEMVTNGPGVGIPTISISRWPYPEKHTSLDSPDIISEANLAESADLVMDVLNVLERNHVPVRTFEGPLFLSGVGLWNKWGGAGDFKARTERMLLRLEGDHTVLDIADELGFDFEQVHDFVTDLAERDLVGLYSEGDDHPDPPGYAAIDRD